MMLPMQQKSGGVVKTVTETLTSSSSKNLAFPDGRAVLSASSGSSIVFFIRNNATSPSTHDVASYMMNGGTVQQLAASTQYSVTYRYVEIE